MKIAFTPDGWGDYLYWQEHDREALRRVNELIRATARDPFKGIGKPEPLRENLKGWWSRRITLEHRLVYRVVGAGDAQVMEIAACRYHY
ncbi:Txe/YoeB family addiction module toxin [Azospirillum sp.]|uniref:Txe/YoeB family addiction module toxin n=1 Tax=Azospirillum sp. TaxID=34012 RepID=UPI003D7184CE